MIQKIITTLLVTLIFGLNCHSQVPGYMGHRFSVEGDVNVLPWFTNAFKNNKSRFVPQEYNYYYDEPDFFGNDFYLDAEYHYNDKNYHLVRTRTDVTFLSINFKKSLSFNYSISSKIDLSLKLELTNSKFVLHNYNFESFNNSIPFLYSEKEQIHYKLIAYNLNFKIYKSNYIAPVGPYFLIGVGYSNVSSKYKVSYLYESYNEDNNYNYKTISENKTVNPHAGFIKLNIGLGQKKFLTDKFYLSTVIESNFYLIGKYDPRFAIINFDKYTVFRNDNSKDIDKEIENNYTFNIGRHIAIDNLIDFKIGLGIIL